MGGRGAGADTQEKQKPPELTKKHNSDWNRVIEDTDRNLFHAVFDAGTQRSAHPVSTHGSNLMNQAQARLKERYRATRQLPKQKVEECKDGDVEMPDTKVAEDGQVKRERLSMLQNTESSLYYQHLIPNKLYKSI